MFASILSFLSSGFLAKLLDYFTKREDTRSQIAVAEIQAEIALRQAQKEIIQVEEGWSVTRWIRPLIVYPFVLHIGAITLDSTFLFKWNIAALPAPYDYLEQSIILSYFLTRPLEKASRNFFSYLRGK